MKAKHLLILLVLVILVSAPLFSSSNAIIPLTSPLYSQYDSLYSLLQMVPPSLSRPWTVKEAELYLDRIDEGNLTSEESYLYSVIEEGLFEFMPRVKKGDFSFSVNGEINPELYVHTNPEAFSSDEYWVHDWVKREPMLKLGLDFSVTDYIYGYTEFLVTGQRNYDAKEYIDFGDNSHASLVFPNKVAIGSYLNGSGDYVAISSAPYNRKISSNITKFENLTWDFPQRAFLSVGGKKWNLMMGVDEISWGNSKVGNFVLDGHIKQQDMLHFSAYTDNFKFEVAYLFLEPNQGNDSERLRFFLSHRIEYSPFTWFSFALSEDLMYQDDTLDLRSFNPMYIFHNLDIRSKMNAIAHLELNFSIAKGFSLYFQGVLDQFKLPSEKTDTQTNAWGVLFGLDYNRIIKKGFLSANIEFIYTTPLLYRRDYIDYIVGTIGHYSNDFMAIDYLGFPYGGDVVMAHAEVKYSCPSVFDVGFSVDGVLKGEMTALKSVYDSSLPGDTDEPNYKGRTPSGNNIIKALTFTLDGEYYVPKFVNFMDISCFASLSYIIMHHSEVRPNAKGNDFQLALGFKVQF